MRPSRKFTGPISPKWLDDNTWVCGDCRRENGWWDSACGFCQRMRSDFYTAPVDTRQQRQA